MTIPVTIHRTAEPRKGPTECCGRELHELPPGSYITCLGPTTCTGPDPDTSTPGGPT